MRHLLVSCFRLSAWPLLLVALATLARIALEPLIGLRSPLLFHTLAVVLISQYRGMAEALIATAFSTVAMDFWLIEPVQGFIPADPADYITLAISLVINVLISVFGGRRKSLLTQLEYLHRRLRLRHEVARIGTYEWFVKENRVVWSPEMEALYGIQSETHQHTVAEWEHMVHPDDRTHAMAQVETAITHRQPVLDMTFRIIRLDGETRWIHARGLYEYDGQSCTHMLGVNIDVTEQKRAEQALRESEIKLRAVLDALPVAVLFIDPDGNIAMANRTMSKLWGADVPMAKIDYDKYRGWWLNSNKRIAGDEWPCARAAQGETIDAAELEIETFDGRQKFISVSASPIRANDGENYGAVAVQQDITNRKRAELALAQLNAALQASNERFLAMAETVPGILFTADPDGSIDYCNSEWWRYTGIAPQPLTGLTWASALHPDDGDRTFQYWMECVKEGKSYDAEYRLRRHDGEFCWFRAHAVCKRNAAGDIVKWYGVSVDISQLKRAEEDLNRSNQELQAFAYTVSHDLREPLRQVCAFSGLLARKGVDILDGDCLNYLQLIIEGSNRMHLMMQGLLEYSRLGSSDKTQREIDSNLVLHDVLQNLQLKIAETKAEVHVGPLPTVQAWPGRLDQVFQNLIQNALKYRKPDVSPVIRVEAEDRNRDWLFCVSDNGEGFEQKQSESIFNLFKQLHARTETGGMGMGLAIVKRIVERHGGQVYAQGSPGMGAKFCFTLPKAAKPADQPAADRIKSDATTV